MAKRKAVAWALVWQWRRNGRGPWLDETQLYEKEDLAARACDNLLQEDDGEMFRNTRIRPLVYGDDD